MGSCPALACDAGLGYFSLLLRSVVSSTTQCFEGPEHKLVPSPKLHIQIFGFQTGSAQVRCILNSNITSNLRTAEASLVKNSDPDKHMNSTCRTQLISGLFFFFFLEGGVWVWYFLNTVLTPPFSCCLCQHYVGYVCTVI